MLTPTQLQHLALRLLATANTSVEQTLVDLGYTTEETAAQLAERLLPAVVPCAFCKDWCRTEEAYRAPLSLLIRLNVDAALTDVDARGLCSKRHAVCAVCAKQRPHLIGLGFNVRRVDPGYNVRRVDPGYNVRPIDGGHDEAISANFHAPEPR